ncbi:unnamed protein product [Penicillium salamii]|uniref:Chromo domain-containing protein n=1 Tax=Penicillium salamii TaxID=1612424 RepID=A0A9W4JSX1_9EURO|nr:unnamed protein product [Penicillium salamii]CAG8301211.1 unnamed protein product [Penicillium salamii]CAG8354082.1 unnamed protein product [Penicillium salamii]CAG8359927.1 unnamed protein product [Penicillium salamii]CAG8367636.1 unnamed protein product [Penicillium salamii]
MRLASSTHCNCSTAKLFSKLTSYITPSNRTMPPPVEDVSDEETGDIPFNNAAKADDKQEDSDKQESDADDDEDDENYVVEKIVRHDWLDDGTLKFFVKWQGYSAIKDHTWEEEENLMEGASEILNAYYKSIGGRPERASEKPKPGRKRKSMGDASSKSATPSKAAAPPAKRGRKSAAAKLAEAETPDSSVAPEDDQGWLPKGKWDKDLKEVSTIQQGRHGEGLFAYLLFNNGKTARVSVQACYDKCPRKMLEFYEKHLVFKTENDD